MPRPYPPEFCQRAIALVREGRQVKHTTADLGIHEVAGHSRLRQDDIDPVLTPGHTSREGAELRAARQRIRQLERELSILKRAKSWLDEEGGVDPKRYCRQSIDSSISGCPSRRVVACLECPGRVITATTGDRLAKHSCAGSG